MLNFRSSAAAAILAICLPSGAHAAVMEQAESFGPVSLGVFNPVETLTFSRFDPSLGTLNAVSITLAATVTGDTTLQRAGGIPAAFAGGSVTRTLTLDLAAAGLSNASIEAVDQWDTVMPAAPGTQVRTRTQSVDVYDTATVNEDTLLAFFIGLGSFELDLLAALTHDIDFEQLSGDWSFMAYFGHAEGAVTLRYDFAETPLAAVAAPVAHDIPAPAALGLVAFGLVGLAMAAKRRRRRGKMRPFASDSGRLGGYQGRSL